ncbi:MAG: 2-C-methyl-D-erythritol 4-phosphate cytidylyltransferase [Candidatus Aminicenantes bacterium]|nr:MAG: 2-C-methyl-D-erythritol 4-phosphate cytidylyltransferase [Candidatus Aminicenantes bacterium]
MKKVSVIIVAAGEGKRFGSAKQFALLKGKTVLDWSLEKFEEHGTIDSIILVLGRDRSGDEYLAKYSKITAIANGGEKRQDSVYSGLCCVDAQETGIILVHDGARPLVGKDLIARTISTTIEKGAVIPVLPLEDTVKRVEGQKILQTEDRRQLFRGQTPQGFSCSLLKEAFSHALRDKFEGTDEAVLVERLGKEVFVIPGDRRNIKITTAEDMKIAEALIED